VASTSYDDGLARVWIWKLMAIAATSSFTEHKLDSGGGDENVGVIGSRPRDQIWATAFFN
jgi:hypothetical protein